MKRKLLPEVIEYKKLSSSTKNSLSSGTLIYHVDDKQCPHCNYLCENDTAVKIHTTHVHRCKICKLFHWDCNGDHTEDQIIDYENEIKRKNRKRNPMGVFAEEVLKCTYCHTGNYFKDKKSLKSHISHQHFCNRCFVLNSDCQCNRSRKMDIN
jgi:hypothetical protein